MSKSLSLIGGIAAIAALGFGGWMLARPDSPAPGFVTPALAQDAAAVETLPDIVMGQADAPVTLIEYASYTCSHCANWHRDILPKLKAEYIDTGKVRFIHREVYFDPFGIWAGLIAQCGGEPRYFAISGMIYEQQAKWIGKGQPQEVGDNLRKVGLQAGLSAGQVDACMNDQAMAERMVATYQKNVMADEIDATPSLVIDGTKYSNMGWEDLKKILDEKLGA